jgi:phospholipid/cholesterol/gamma-HCH transport system substrate-binding protein
LTVYRSLSRRQAVLLALVVLTGLGLGVLGLFAVGSRHWLGGAFHVRAAFADAGGVEPGTRVRIQGLDAGEVEDIALPDRPGGPVVLRLRVAGKFRPLVGADAAVEIANESLFGGKVVRILPGKSGAPPAADDALLAGRPAVELTQELAGAVTRLDRVLSEVEGTVRGVRQGKGSLGKLVRDEGLYNDLTATVAEAKAVLRDVRKGEGTLGQLAQSKEAYTEAVKSLRDVRSMVSSVKQNADAIKALPVVRSYVRDANKELIRPDCKRLRKWYREAELFEPGHAVLTAGGRRRLDAAAGWLKQHKEAGSEVVVAAFADPARDPDFAHNLTEKQSEVVRDYLRSNHRVHRVGWWWWSNRRVEAIGCGVNPPPVPEAKKLPPARVELIVFVPQN